MKRYLFILLALTACNRDPGRSGGSIGLTPNPPAQPPTTPTNPTGDPVPNLIFILAGQSNMEGYAALPGTIPQSDHVLAFKNGKWQVAQDPIHNVGVGPGMAFASDTANRFPGTIVGLVPCAVGSTTIGEWQPGEHLFEDCMQKARAAAPGGIAGVLWLQGESDAEDPNLAWITHPLHAADYAYMLSNVIQGFSVLNRDMVFMIGQIGTIPAFDPARFPNWGVVQTQQDTMNSTQTPVIHTSDLNPDGVLHFHTQEAQEIGHRYAKAYWIFVNRGE